MGCLYVGCCVCVCFKYTRATTKIQGFIRIYNQSIRTVTTSSSVGVSETSSGLQKRETISGGTYTRLSTGGTNWRLVRSDEVRIP